MWRRLIWATLSFGLAFWWCAVYFPVQADDPDRAAASALDAIVDWRFDPAHPAAALPGDWPAVMGYSPQTTTGPGGVPILIKPDGDCSSFTGRTEYDFTAVCKEHDLAYDVVRYAERVGRPLPASARAAADDMFGRDLHGRCDQLRVTGWDSFMCHTYAEGFVQAVRINSWRQGYRAPDQESPWLWSAMWTSFLLLLITPRLLRRCWAPAPAPGSAQRGQGEPFVPVDRVVEDVPVRRAELDVGAGDLDRVADHR